MASVSEALLAQHESIITAGKVLHAELEDIVGQLTQEVEPEYDERPLRPLAPPQLKDLPPGVRYVCNAGPTQTLPCYLCVQGGECDPSEWDLYRVPVDLGHDPRGSHPTISGLAPQINSIVVGYLGTFCSFTYVAYVGASLFP